MVWYSTVWYGKVQYSAESRLLFYHGNQVCKGSRDRKVKVHSGLGHLKNISHTSLFPEEGQSCYNTRIMGQFWPYSLLLSF